METEEDFEALSRYAEPLIHSVWVEPHVGSPISVWTVRTLPPKTTGETYVIALCCEQRPEQARVPRRYYTLEFSFDQRSACFCGWTADHNHLNYGLVRVSDEHEFAVMALRHMREISTSAAE